MPKTDRIEATKAAYIKLGSKGRWETQCLRDGTLRLGYDGAPHEVAMAGDVDALRRHFVQVGHNPRIATAYANQVHKFYSAGPETLWITFSGGYLHWAIADGLVEYLGGSAEEMAQRGSRFRKTRDGWQNKSVNGTPLRIPELNGALTRTAAFRMTICAVEQFDYLIRKINDEALPQIAAAQAAKAGLLESTVDLMNLLTWRDFELLVELVFSQSGWRRVSASGGTQKTIDIELVLPTTGETAFVQVKSRTNQAQFDDYMARFDERGDGRMFYVYHTANKALRVEDERVSIVGPDKLAELILETGLFDWLLKKVG
jgi:hypothetical protein